jgi:bacterioferritin-associated ferredoxin
MPSIDTTSILISIRIASYGHDMEISSTCPKCNETQDYSLDMRSILDSLQKPDYSKTLTVNDLEIFFGPMSYRQQTQIGMEQYETQRIIAGTQDSSLSEQQKTQALNEAMKRISLATTRAMAFGISGIRSPDGFASESEHIVEFLSNCDRKIYNSIRDHEVTLRSQTDIKPINITCTACENQYQQQIELDLANFFVAAS